MFIKFLIVIFTVFIAYLLFSNNTIQEGMKKKKAPKGFRKAKKKGNKSVENVPEDGEDTAEDTADNVSEQLPTPEQLPKLVNDLKTQVNTMQIQIQQLLQERPTVPASALAEDDAGAPEPAE